MAQEIITLLGEIPGFWTQFIVYLLIFARLIGFFHLAPIFSRKEFIMMAKVGFIAIMSLILLPYSKVEEIPQDIPLLVLILINITEGLFLGLITRIIFEVVRGAGDFANNQMSLSSATMFDPSSKMQSSLMGNVANWVATVVFMGIGGIEWLFMAFVRSFEFYPLAGVVDITRAVTEQYWIEIAGNTIIIAFVMVAPIIVVTLCVDIILGITSKVAPQINVFQLSFMFKPFVGSLVFFATINIFWNVVIDYFHEYSNFF